MTNDGQNGVDEGSGGEASTDVDDNEYVLPIDDVSVLFVDDDATFARTQARLLQRHHGGFDVDVATSVEAATRHFGETEPDCIVCDYQLGDGTGLDLLATVREQDPKRPFVLVTGKGNEGVASDAITRGVTDYIRKETLSEQPDLLGRRIATAVRSYLAERALASERRSKEAMLEITTSTNTRRELSRDFCRHLVEERGYECAWIGAVDSSGDVVPLADAGQSEYVDAVIKPGTNEAQPTEPALRALEQDGPHVVNRIGHGPEAGAEDHFPTAWEERAREFGFGSAAAVPIQHGDVRVGVLAVYASEADAVTPRERDILSEYGSTIGYAVQSSEWKQTLLSSTNVTADFQIADTAVPLVALDECLPAAAVTTVTTAVVRNDTEILYLGRVSGVSASEFERAATTVDAIRSVTVQDDESLRYKLVAETPTPESLVVDAGGQFEETTVEHGIATVTAMVPNDRDIEVVVSTLTTVFDDVTVTTTWSDRTAPSSAGESDPIDDLTDRQREVLEVAYMGGYFERPRENNASELAESLDISRATFAQHLRAAERKLFSDHL
jgi:predicted DNA binding protein/ActR/RegA family two-component response regulator